jgi:solute carrier family 13 (sodium-dependent dicarboxylate transporter), member 2/3/5
MQNMKVDGGDSEVAETAPAAPTSLSRFDELRRRIGLILGPLAFVLILLAPLSGQLSPEAHRLAAIMGLVIVFWVTEAIPLPVTALLGPTLAVMMSVATVTDAFAPIANPLIFLFMGSFILARALFVHRVNERIAYAVLSWRFVGARPARILVAYGAVAAMLSAWMSNTATAAMLLPIALSLLAFMEAEGKVPHSYGTTLTMMTSYGCSRGGMMTPVGTPPNLIAVGMLAAMTGTRITFVEWMLIAMPLSILLFAIVCAYLTWVGGVRAIEVPGAEHIVEERRRGLGRMRRGEINALIAFGVTVALWIVPGLLTVSLGTDDPLARRVTTLMPESVAALVGATLLFVLPISDTERSTVTWREASQIDWGTLLLFGGGLALGTMAAATGLAEAVGRGITGIVPTDSVIGLAFAGALFGVVLSETMSNTAAANIAVPIIISIAMAAGVDPVVPAMSAVLGASVADALPVSTPPNAIVYASGRVPILKMIQYGVVLDTSAVILVPIVVLLMARLVL